MPRLSAEAAHGVVFENHYAPVGWTSYSLISILQAIHPPMRRYSKGTFSLPTMPGVSMADSFKRRGYKTVFLAAGDPHWANKEWIEDGAFDVVRTGTELGPEQHTSWGVRDQYLFEALGDVMREEDGRPFFIVAWTEQTHHPYRISGDEEIDDDRQRYLRNIQEVDGLLGGVFAQLRQSGLAEETLVVVTGDHGEGFGDLHGTSGHGFTVFEEEVRVPLLIWNPRLFPTGRRVSTIGSQLDLAPTLFDLMGIPAPAGWHGRSLFASERVPRVYFFAAAHGEYLLGVRDEDWKYIVDVRRGSQALYNLRADPQEQTDLAPRQRERTSRMRQRLAAWLQFQDETYAWVQATTRAD